MERIRPFYCGSQYLDWLASNCERCTKSTWEGDFTCDIQEALSLGCIGDGRITKDIADRMGYYQPDMAYVWPCNEVEWTEEWKAEWEAKRERRRTELLTCG